jgi:hypothetical protein
VEGVERLEGEAGLAVVLVGPFRDEGRVLLGELDKTLARGSLG